MFPLKIATSRLDFGIPYTGVTLVQKSKIMNYPTNYKKLSANVRVSK